MTTPLVDRLSLWHPLAPTCHATKDVPFDRRRVAQIEQRHVIISEARVHRRSLTRNLLALDGCDRTPALGPCISPAAWWLPG